jgi:hypothetical protein
MIIKGYELIREMTEGVYLYYAPSIGKYKIVNHNNGTEEVYKVKRLSR